VGASWVANQLGQTKFRQYFTELYGSKTGVDLPSETGALIGNLSKPEQVYYDTASFGEGIAVSPVQMIRALGAIANGGVMVTPHLVSGIQLDSGITRTIDWGEGARVFSAQAAQETTVMMDSLFDNVIDQGHAKIPTMSVAAKTGTAQLPTPTGTYYDDRFVHSEVAFFPSFNPRFIILLYTNDPKNVTYASETLTPELLDLVHFLIDYYAIPPDRGFSTSTPAS
jgi:cell division protein FtsI/penicillin-binding protein 2